MNLSLLLFCGLLLSANVTAQDATAMANNSACKKAVASCETPCAPSKAALQAAFLPSATSVSLVEDTPAKVNCVPINCDPADCPPICKILCPAQCGAGVAAMSESPKARCKKSADNSAAKVHLASYVPSQK